MRRPGTNAVTDVHDYTRGRVRSLTGAVSHGIFLETRQQKDRTGRQCEHRQQGFAGLRR